MISRRLRPVLEASSKSLLLLGPRQTGKSTLMQGLAPHWVALAEVSRRKHTPLVLYLGDAARKIQGCDVLPWQEGLGRIGL